MLAVSTEESLRAVADSLSNHHVAYSTVVESDPPYTGQMTAIGVVPVRDRHTVKRCLSSLPLLR